MTEDEMKALIATYDVLCAMCGERKANVRLSPRLGYPDEEGFVTVFPVCARCATTVDLIKWVKNQKKAERAAKRATK